MSDQSKFWALALAGSLVLPCGYVALCVWMMRRRVWWFTYIAYFCLFGAVGGWCLTLLFSNGPLLLLGVFWSCTAAVLSCLGSSLVLQFRRQKSRFELVAMIGGYLYTVALAGVALAATFLST